MYIHSRWYTPDLYLLTTVISTYPIVAPKESIVAPKESIVAPKESIVAPKESIVAQNKTSVMCLQLEGNLLHISVRLKFLPAGCFFLRDPERWKSPGAR